MRFVLVLVSKCDFLLFKRNVCTVQYLFFAFLCGIVSVRTGIIGNVSL